MVGFAILVLGNVITWQITACKYLIYESLQLRKRREFVPTCEICFPASIINH